MTLPAVDVVVLTLDRRHDINACIDSVLAQDHPDLHLWVIDQGSTAETVDELRQRALSNGFDLHQSGRIGIAAGRNLGNALGRAPVIISLDNDAVFADRGVARRAAECLAEHDELAAVAFAVHDFHHQGPDLGCWVYPWPVATHFDQAFPTARFCGGAHAVRREAFEQAGGYDPEFFFFGEELDLAYALVAAGWLIQYRPDLAVRHKASAEGRIDWRDGRLYHNARNMLYLNRKHFGLDGRQWLYAGGYLVKGLLNGMPGDAWRGVRDGLRLAASVTEAPLLDAPARDYIHRHELAPRGGMWRRFRREVVPPLRPTGPS